MTFPADAQPGTAVRWTGELYEEETARVRPGDVGTFIVFDGPPGDPEVVVAFPGLTFVCSSDDVEVVVDPQERSDRP